MRERGFRDLSEPDKNTATHRLEDRHREVIEAARYVPSTQLLNMPFHSELIHCAAQV
jgi:hypothetical protein